mmetsp:Transcript_20479/g.31973  ORF Transcript_20479/g.31973 Transcript_20479/m.31973 type:complete len:1304 (-) Transcript_20479:80-3991(-)
MSIVFSVNGKRHELSEKEVDPRKTLAEFLRYDLSLTGTKVSCAEGGCGACTVTIEKADNSVHSVNACLFPVPNLDGVAVTTVEGLGGKDGANLHPVQDRIAKFNGLQCGFCTPGMVSNTYSALKEHGDDLSPEQVESLFDGNLCRCTGYRPLLDAAKSLCSNNDIEDLLTGGKAPCGAYNHEEHDPKFPDFLKEYKPCEKTFETVSEDGATRWVRPSSLEEAMKVLEGAKGTEIVRPVFANTGAAIYKDTALSHSSNGLREVIVSLQGVKSLHAIEATNEGLRIGACATLRSFEKALRANNDKTNGVFGRMASHIARIGNRHVRAAGSLVGNLTLCKKHAFWSDAAVVCMAAEAKVQLVTGSALKRETVTLPEFFASNSFTSPEQIVESVFIPFPAAGAVWRSYKISMRPQNAHALANCAFKVVVEGDKITNAQLVFGCLSDEPNAAAHAVLATKTADAIVGKSPSHPDTLKAAIGALKEEVQPRGHEHVEYRAQLHSGFLFKLFRALNGDKVAEEEEAAFSTRPATKSSQKFTIMDPIQDAPVHEAIPKLSGPSLASGNAKFGDDFPTPYNCLFASLVQSTEARALIKSVDASEALKLKGVHSFVTAKDIKGKNNCSPMGQDHPVFAEGKVQYYGQPIGMILASSTRLAFDAAKLVKVEYDTEGKKPVLTIEQSIAEGMVTPVVATTKNKEGTEVGEALEKSAKVTSGVVYLGSQLHFYMEGMNTTVIPDEDESFVVQVGNQWPGANVGGVGMALGVAANKVRVIHRRSGGGFGGRLTHPIQFAAAAAVGAQASGRPVRIVADRDRDSLMCGGREECRVAYKVGYEETGKITALKVDCHQNSGWTVGLSWFCNGIVPASMNECYNIPSFEYNSTLVLSNKGTRTAVRGPGEIPASYSMETILEKIAHELGKDVHEVRKLNLYPKEGAEKFILPNGSPLVDYTVPDMWDKLEKKTDFEARKAAVDEYNKTHKWTKRGLTTMPMRYGVNVFAKGSLVNIYEDGSIIIFHGCADIGQGCSVKIAQAVASVLNKLAPVDLSLIRFGDMDTFVIPNETFTGGSTGSEGAAAAAMKAAKTLRDNLTPVLEKLQQKKKDEKKEGEEAQVTWKELCGAANASFPFQTTLSAVGHFGLPEDGLAYQNFGVGYAEVELDVLTGQVRCTHSSILYDCGESLNPAIDIGQAEGAYIMGLGYCLRETCKYDPDNGKLLNVSTWEYKPSFAGDVPEKFDIEFLHNPNFKKGILSSKSSGEPPLVLSGSVLLAVRQCIREVRKDNGNTDWFDLEVPATPDQVRKLCGVSADAFAQAL